jgi:adenylosuccinate synthase
VKCYIGNGVVLSTAKLLEEIEGLEKAGVEVRSRLRISEACPLILPIHAALDIAREARREQGGTEKIGTTGRGIGPAYEDKIARRACACRT